MDVDHLKDRLKCCACGVSLKKSSKLNFVLLMKEAEWPFPWWGNLIVGVSGLAQAVVCDDCAKNRKKPKYAVEWENRTYRKIKYHPVDKLKDVPPEIFDALDVLEPGRHGVAG